MKKRYISLAVVALLMTISLTVKNTLAYFSTYSRSDGTVAVSLTDVTDFEEEIKEGYKDITITNEGNGPVYVRFAVFYPSDLAEAISINDSNWKYDGSMYYTYNQALPAGESVNLHVNIDQNSDAFKKAEERGTVNIVVVYETTTSESDGNGDWSAVVTDLSNEGSHETTQGGAE